MLPMPEPTQSGPALPLDELAAADGEERDEPVPPSADEGDKVEEPIAPVAVQRSPAERDALARELVADAALRAYLEGVIRRRGIRRPVDIEDVLQVTYFAASGANLPTEARARRRYIAGIAAFKALDALEQAGRFPKILPDKALTRVARAVPAEAASFELRSLDRRISGDDRPTWVALLWVLDGDRIMDLADELKIPADQLRKRIRRLQARVAAGVLAILAFFGYRADRVPSMALDTPLDPEPLEPAVDTRGDRPDPSDVAPAVRARAFRACLRYAWSACLDDLDLAREIDPAGDADPRVQAARVDANDGIAHDDGKPGGWTPRNAAIYRGAAYR